MEEREPEERAEQGPLLAADQPADKTVASLADSASGPVVPEDQSGAQPAVEVVPEPPDEMMSPEGPGSGARPDVEAGVNQASPVAEAMTAEEVAKPAAEKSAVVSPTTGSLRGGRMPQGDVTADSSTEPAWYVIHCYSGYENKVRHNLEQRIETMGMKDRIFDVVIPTQEEIEVREGKRRTVERHIFPGYVLVNMSLSEESWYVVRNTPGVTGFVGMGNLPTALRPEEVSQIIKRMEADAPTVKVSFKVGERVRIVDGPFNDFRGTVADIDMERTKVRVMVSFFGRETPVELDFLQVEKA
jgi:transcriptional antiterminator NusG